MKTLAALALTLAACTDVNTTWTDGTTVAVVVQTAAPEASALAFKRRAQRDVALWNEALVDYGCAAPFEFVDDASGADVTIYLRSKPDWPFTGSIGAQFADSIHILSQGDGTLDAFVDDPMWIPLLHELGHGMGLGHNTYTDSVMQDGYQPDDLPLSRLDVERAAVGIGCTYAQL